MPPSLLSAPASWAPLPLLSPPAPSSVPPLLPLFRPPLGTMHVSMLYTLHDTYLPTGCIHPRHFRASDALPAACIAPAGFPAAGGLAVCGAPSRGPPACDRACLRGPHLKCVGSGRSHCAQDAQHAARHAPLLSLFPYPLPFFVSRPLCAPLAPHCLLSLSHARCTTNCGAPASPAFPRLPLARPCVLAVSLLPLPPSLRTRCRALRVASTLPLFAPPRRLCPLVSRFSWPSPAPSLPYPHPLRPFSHLTPSTDDISNENVQ